MTTNAPPMLTPILAVSAAWLNKRVDCTLDGITRDGGCGAACCHSGPTDTRWPARSAPGIGNRPCARLGPDGCTLDDARPVTCHLYPLRIVRGRLVLHNRVLLGIPCGSCANTGPRVVEALDRSLRLLFGGDQVDRMRVDVDAGRDSWLEVTPAVAAALAREAEWEFANLVPEPQTYRDAPC